MDYKETITYLFNSTPVFENVGKAAYKEGLANTLALDEHFGHPHSQYKTIHVAGTNGKGSCSHTLAAILQSEGYKVGLYTSPHLIDFRERIRINGKCISEQEVIDFVEKEKYFFEPLHPSFFELTTAMAFKYFADQHIDIAVIEVGLGGRLDCTNIITPILSIITNISFDHTQFLGNTLTQIANEKAGIIKHSIPIIIGETNNETRPVFVEKAKSVDAPIYFAEEYNDIVATKQCDNTIVYTTKHYGKIQGELSGDYQIKNTRTILCAVQALGNIIKNPNNVAKGMANVCKLTGLMGRWQTIQRNPTIVCDTGHNIGGWNYLSKQLKRQKYKHLRIVFGMVDDKDIEGVLQMMPQNATYYFTRAISQRAIPEDIVMMEASKYDLQGKAFQTVSEAYLQALQDANNDDFIFIGGSSYIVADFLDYIRKQTNNQTINSF